MELWNYGRRESLPGGPMSGVKATMNSNGLLNNGSGNGFGGLLAQLRASSKIDPNALAGQAATDVQAQIDEQRASNVRQQGEMGLSPIGFTNNESIYAAAMKAGAANRARLAGENMNFDRSMDLARLDLANASSSKMGGGITTNKNESRQKLLPTGLVRTMGGGKRMQLNAGRF